MIPLWAFDAVLATGLVLVAWLSLRAATLFKGVVLFITFGLLMALAWVRLDAVDVALAEAAIGAGLTGALILDALGHVAGEPKRPDPTAGGVPFDDDGWTGGRLARAGLTTLAIAVSAIVGLAYWTMPLAEAPVRAAVLAALEDHPVKNAATAVLIDFRAYDTFLEMAVLTLAGCGAFLLQTRTLHAPRAVPPVRGSVMLRVMANWLAPLMALVGFYLFWAGASHSGGAFPAGAMLGAAGVLLFLAGVGRDEVADNTLTRLLLAGGAIAFLFAGLLSFAAGRAFLGWSPDWTYATVVAIELALTVSIGGTLWLLYAAAAKEPAGPAGGDGG